MRISTPRKQLQDAIAATADPAEISKLTARLVRLLEVEDRRRGRTARARRRKAEQQPTAPTLDPDEEFDIEETAPAILTPQAHPVEVARQKVDATAPTVDPAPIPTAPPVTGWTRTISALEPLEVYDWSLGRYVPSVNPQSSLGPQEGATVFDMYDDCVESNSYTAHDGFSFERRDPETGEYYKTNEREERERKEQAQREREENQILDRWWGK